MTGWLLVRLGRGQDAAQWALRGLIVAVVALAGVVLLTLASVPNVLDAQERTLGWTFLPEDPNAQARVGLDPDWVALARHYEHLDGERVSVVVAGAAGAAVSPPPGLSSWPAPGEAVLAPGVAQLLREVGARPDHFGRPSAELGADALRGPDDLLVVRGARPEQVDSVAVPLTELAVGVLPRSPVDTLLRVVLGLAASAAVVPPLLLAATVLQSNEESRRRRFRRLTLGGVSRQVLVRLAVLETAMIGALGWLGGVLAFLAARPVLAQLPTWEIKPHAEDLVAPQWAFLLAGLPAVIIVVWALISALDWTGSLFQTRGAPARSGVLLLFLAGLAAWALAAAPTSAGVLASSAAGAAAIYLLGPGVLRGLGTALSRSPRPAGHLAGAYLRSSAVQLNRQFAPSVLACYVAALFITLNPAAVASAQAGVITQGEDTALVRITAADRNTTDRLVKRLGDVAGVKAVAPVFVGDLQRQMAHPVTVWLGNCEELIEASSLPDHLCRQETSTWGTVVAAGEFAGGRAEVLLPHGRIPEPTNGVPDENQPVALTVEADATGLGALSTPTDSWDLPGLLVDPQRAGLDLGWFRPSALTLSLDDDALTDVNFVVTQEVPTATITTRETGLWGFAGQLERYYSQLLTGALAVFVVGAVGALVLAWSHQVERLASHAVLHASGVSTGTIRRAVAMMMVIPLAALGALAAIVGLTVGFGSLGGRLSYLGEVLGGLVPFAGALTFALAAVGVATLSLGSRIGPDRLRAE